MIDALGAPQSVLVLGGSSEIAVAIVRTLPRQRLNRVVLAGRPGATRAAAAAELSGRGIKGVSEVDFDALDTSSHVAFIDEQFDAGDFDIVILAFGVLGDQAIAESDVSAAVAVAQTNYVGAVSSGLLVAQRLRQQGHGTLVVLSSVAGDRARRSNFVYGSTKAGLDAFSQGLGDALYGSGAHVLIVRPGFVRGRMTAGMPDAPLSTDPKAVAKDVVEGIRKRKSVVYSPKPLRFVMAGLKVTPRAIFRKLPM